jgi:HlyD family secretion protein
VARAILHGEGEMTIAAAMDGTISALPGPQSGAVRRAGTGGAGPTPCRMHGRQRRRLQSAKGGPAARLALRLRKRGWSGMRACGKSGGRVPSINEMENARADLARAQGDHAGASQSGAARKRRKTARMAAALARAPFAGYLVACLVARASSCGRANRCSPLSPTPIG